ncbi:methyltransferase type 12 [Polychytrium aggregatum]|uniref:methyltransferase type 12 n=1 Tax=Polychytrium aggregatum TaxID=110093 RepID=UPI0022FF1DDA|nr:methyltransferase type 12 [Polychytrium aggregatum]KAI9208975.1 methyltransferase type 12 [Polychytrium aggregatum]
MNRNASFWDDRFEHSADLAYGALPNKFLVETSHHLKPGSKILSLGEGEGRNAIYLAQQSHLVHCVDFSRVGLDKAASWAKQLGLSAQISTEVADVASYKIHEDAWDAVILFWCHLPTQVQKDVHRRMVKGLKADGLVILEVYSPKNVGRGTGGPETAERCTDIDNLREGFAGLAIERLEESEHMISEGQFHQGLSVSVRLLARNDHGHSTQCPQD